jgi:hypothetical protein
VTSGMDKVKKQDVDHDHRVARDSRPGDAVRAVVRSTGHPLPTNVRGQMEDWFGADFSDVRVHTDTLAQSSARSIDALAYTSGPHIVLGSGVNVTNWAVLTHELSHVLQQRHGPVPGTPRVIVKVASW